MGRAGSTLTITTGTLTFMPAPFEERAVAVARFSADAQRSTIEMIINIATEGGRNRARPGLKQLHALFHLMKIGAPSLRTASISQNCSLLNKHSWRFATSAQVVMSDL